MEFRVGKGRVLVLPQLVVGRQLVKRVMPNAVQLRRELEKASQQRRDHPNGVRKEASW